MKKVKKHIKRSSMRCGALSGPVLYNSREEKVITTFFRLIAAFMMKDNARQFRLYRALYGDVPASKQYAFYIGKDDEEAAAMDREYKDALAQALGAWNDFDRLFDGQNLFADAAGMARRSQFEERMTVELRSAMLSMPKAAIRRIQQEIRGNARSAAQTLDLDMDALEKETEAKEYVQLLVQEADQITTRDVETEIPEDPSLEDPRQMEGRL